MTELKKHRSQNYTRIRASSLENETISGCGWTLFFGVPVSRRRKTKKQKVAVCSGGFSFFVGDSRSLRTYKPTTRNSVKENLLLPLHTPRMYSEKEFLLFQSALKKGRKKHTNRNYPQHAPSKLCFPIFEERKARENTFFFLFTGPQQRRGREGRK